MTISNDPIVIVSAVRTPMGGFQGELKSLTAPQLGAAAIAPPSNVPVWRQNRVEEVLFGCVLLRRPRPGPGASSGTGRRAG